MKVQFVLFCLLTAVVSVEPQPEVFTVHEGEDFRNIFKSFGTIPLEAVTYLCRSPCLQGDMLMQVHGKRTKSGRYNLRRETQADVHVAITQVMKQDTGLYRVGVKSSTSEKHKDFQLIIKHLCGGGVTMHRKQEHWVSKGSNLDVTCNIDLQARNRKFLCRGECSAYLIDTNDLKGYSAKYGVQYLSHGSFKVTIYNVGVRDEGQYCCGVGREDSPNKCQQFTLRVDGTTQTNQTEEGDSPTADIHLTEEDHHPERTGLALPIVSTVLVGVILTLVVLLIRKWKKTQTPLYVNSVPGVRTSAADPQSQAASYNNSDPTYCSLDPKTRENVYDPLQFQKVPEDTERDYAPVY